MVRYTVLSFVMVFSVAMLAHQKDTPMNNLSNFFNTVTLVDLTHKINETVPTWGGTQDFCKRTVVDYADCSSETKFLIHEIHFKKIGLGTHIDAPHHSFAYGKSVDQLPLADLCAPLVVINVTHTVHADYQITIDDIHHYESAYGLIQPGSFVIAYTGWDSKWHDSLQYRNVDADGAMHFPVYSVEAVKLLLDRGVVGIGIDTLSPELDPHFPIHGLVLGAGKYIVENVANISQMPVAGSYVMVLPLNIEGAGEAPVRLVGLIQK